MLVQLATAQTGNRGAMKAIQGNPGAFLKVVEGGDVGTVTAPVPTDANAVTLLNANTARTGVFILNSSTQALNVKLSATAMSSAADYSYQIASGAVWPVPVGYTGKITAWLAGADGAAIARVTEITCTALASD